MRCSPLGATIKLSATERRTPRAQHFRVPPATRFGKRFGLHEEQFRAAKLPGRGLAMSAEYDRAPDPSLLIDDVRGLITTVEGAEEARRHAAEIGDYAMAQRWLWHERQ